MDSTPKKRRPGVAETIELIKRLHAGTHDYTGAPYWMHPVAVMEMLPPDADDDERMAALLHDTLEDTDADEAYLRELGYSDRVIALVSGLSRNRAADGMTYMDWIRSIAASGDISLIRIKHLDNRHNSDPARIAAISDPARRNSAAERVSGRYARSMKILAKALDILASDDAEPRRGLA